MADTEKLSFKNPHGADLSISEVSRELVEYMKADGEHPYKITIGTDSLLCNNKEADFVTAIVIHRIGNGGRYFWRRVELKNFHTLRDRILREVMTSLDIAKEFLAQMEEIHAPKFSFEIHIDVGENGETKKMIQELVGMIRANNFEAKTKPYSYAASSIADRHV